MDRRIDVVDASGEHRDRPSPGEQRPAMGRRVDPERAAADDGHSRAGETLGELLGTALP